MRNNKILLIDDDLELASTLKDFFEDNGFSIICCHDGKEAVGIFDKAQPDIVILDIILPNKNGFSIIKQIKERSLSTPIILITGTEFEQEKEIKGYQLGAINYLHKPLIPQAVLALVRTLLYIPPDQGVYQIGKYKILISDQLIEVNGERTVLRDKDSQALAMLFERTNKLVTRKEMLIHLWGTDDPNKNNFLDTTINRLRKVLKPYDSIKISNIYGSGYILEVQS